MSVAPFSGSVIILRENTDGIHIEAYHWDNLPDGTTVPPRGPITSYLAGATSLPIGSSSALPYTFHTERMSTTRADLIAKFTSYVNNKFPDTTP